MACTSSVVSIQSALQIHPCAAPRISARLRRSSIQSLTRGCLLHTVQRQEEFYLKLERAKQQEQEQ